MNDLSDSMKVIYADETIVVVEKKSGFLSVPGKGEHNLDSVSWRITKIFPQSIPQPSVHRLDMDTSGLLVLALTAEAHRHLSEQFANRQVEKLYEALLEGELTLEKGIIELPFRLDVERRPYQIYDAVHGKMGITHWKKISVENNLTRVEFNPLTGRTHQLRVHAAHPLGLGTPIVGDPLYGTGQKSGALKLHAKFLKFIHPLSHKEMSFFSQVPF